MLASILFTCLRNLKIKIYKTIILPVVLYGCETWSHTKEEYRLRVSENIGPEREGGEMEGGSGRKLEKTE